MSNADDAAEGCAAGCLLLVAVSVPLAFVVLCLAAAYWLASR